ncbi:MAG: hypothetical protein A2V70_10015 [Planctomycetes bacterium RBG_13_63_9]|nr:MAG: hypothetical protein A2V70_10015 [Planctomycetes bacterium RBG_13_63_9]
MVFQQLGISLLLGLLVGLQREHVASGTAGMRTFPLITVLGTVSAILAAQFGGWVIAAALLGVGALLTLANLLRLRQEGPDPGNTTNAAMLLMFLVGALLTVQDAMPVAIAVGGGVAVLLQLKPELHRVARKLGDEDLRAIMQFVLITCIILPVLPNQTYGPLDVFNPRETWLMVALIVGMSLGGYIVYKFFGRDAGILLGGILGGVISSTATTVSYSRQARDHPPATHNAAIVILVASTIVYLRVLIEVAVVAPDFLRLAAAPVAVLMALTLVPALALWFRVRRQPAQMPNQENPTQLKSALVFGAMYALVLFALAAARRYVGDQGLFMVAGLSGLTDMDAITLSTARMSTQHAAVAAEGWRLIVVAALANLLFKAAVAGVVGGRRLLRQVAVLFCLPFAGGLAMLLLL